MGFQNSACEHKGNHSKEILSGPSGCGPRGSFQNSGCGCAATEVCAAGSAKSRGPKLAVPYKDNRETFVGFLLGIFYNNQLIIDRDCFRILNEDY